MVRYGAVTCADSSAQRQISPKSMRRHRNEIVLRTLLLGASVLPPAIAQPSDPAGIFLGARLPYVEFDRLASTRMPVPGGEIVVAFAPGALALPRERVLEWIRSAATAVATYYGRFPASSTRLLLVPRAGGGLSGGKAWGHGGAAVRVTIGEHATEAELGRDWVLVHEMTHLAFPSMRERHHWIEEGIATYVEPIARAQAGQLAPETVWAELAAGLPKGLPQAGDRGLDHTPTWGRTYWGGALFCLLADLEIRRRTGNRRGLQDALRAILAGGNMETHSALEPVLALGDRATGVPVLAELYREQRDKAVDVDLAGLWRRLGVRLEGRSVRFDDSAPEAEIRRAITTRPAG